jgi:hypothetical protein
MEPGQKVSPALLRAGRLAIVKRARLFQRATVDLAAFIPLVCQDAHGTPLALAPVHLAWLQHVDYCWRRGLKCLILAPFGHGKSSSLLCPVAAHSIGRNGNIRIKVVTNDDDSAAKRVAAVRQIIGTPEFRTVFPDIKPGSRWTGHEMYVMRTGQAIDPTIQARGIFTTGIGGRCDLLLLDDIVDQKNAANAIQRARVIDLAEQTWLSRLEPDGCLLAIGTAWHQGDAYHRWMHQPGWCTLVQSVAHDCQSIEQVVHGAGEDYPGQA